MERELKFVHQSYSATPISEMLRDRGNLKQLIAVVVVFVESQLCGINSVGMYTDQIFTKGGVPEDKVTYASTLVYSVQLLVALVGVSQRKTVWYLCITFKCYFFIVICS